MNHDEANQTYNGPIPKEYRQTFIHGSYEAWHAAYLITAERNFLQRFRDILSSLRVWRYYAAYPQEIKNQMLGVLSNALYQARFSAIEAWDDAAGALQLRSSASAVMALPINTV